MYRRVEWLVPADRAILGLLAADRRLTLQPGNIAQSVGYTRQHVGRRCRILYDKTLLDREDDGYYRITDFGVEVLDEQMPPEELEERVEERQRDLGRGPYGDE
ncbi:helix-turn-helix domain-containing protein [Halocalculus aciditolerans]|nr:MarR family transcriptional regulator [Halocalculus aciditolerans]